MCTRLCTIFVCGIVLPPVTGVSITLLTFDVFQVLVMAGLNARGLQSKLLITPLVSEAIIIIIILQVWFSLTTCTLGLATVVITLGNLASFPSYSCLVYMIL